MDPSRLYSKLDTITAGDSYCGELRHENSGDRTYQIGNLPLSTAIYNINNDEFSENSIKINTYKDSLVGDSRVHFMDWRPEHNTIIARGFVKTHRKDLARELIKKTAEELENYAKRYDVRIHHEEGFLTEDSRNKLPHIYRELGYEDKDGYEGQVLTRTYV